MVLHLTQMALVGSLLIAGILALRPLLLQRLPKATFLVLWELAALRMLVPLAIPVPAGALPLPVLGVDTAATQVTPVQGPPPSWTEPVNTAGPGLLPLLWGLGTAALALWLVWRYTASLRLFRTSLPFEDPAAQAWLQAHPIRRPLSLRVSDQIRSPLTYGTLRPVILLPKGMDPAALEPVLTHELIHVRRFDPLAKLVFAAALCLHWWNPLVWALYVLADRDMELSCDEAVLRLLGGEARRDYALTLLSLEELRRTSAPLCSCFSRHILYERIESIMKFKKTSATALLGAALLTVGAVSAFAAERPPAALEKSPLPYGYALDLHDLQSLELEDGSILYAPKGVDLTTEHLATQPVTYVVTPQDQSVPTKLTDLPHTDDLGPVEQQSMGQLLSVQHSDQSKFTPEAWAQILEQIEAGQISWED